MLTFVGAVIVFFTFVVKDAFREQVKDLADVILSSENMFLLRTDMSRLSLSLESHRRLVEETKPPTTRVQADNDERERMWIYASIDRDSEELDRSSALLDKLPMAIKRRSAIELAGVRQQLQQLKVDVVAKREWYGPSEGGFHLYDPMMNLFGQQLRISSALDALQEHILADSKQAEQRYDQRYKFATWASYILYAVGWGLGLAGRLVGVEAIGGGGD